MKRAILFFALVLFASALQAADIAVLGKVGTLGLGVDLGFPLDESWTVRLNANGASRSESVTESDIDYDFDARARTAGMLLDWNPGGSMFRLSVGAYYNGNKVEATARPTNGTIEINNRTYAASEVGSLTGKVDFKRIAPYVGIGVGNLSRKGFKVTADFGALYQQSPRVSMQVNCGTTLRCAQLRNDVDAETQQFRDDISKYKWWPVIAFGIGWSF